MIEKINYTGYWFLPNNEEDKVAGTLTYLANEKIQLELLGSFDHYSHPLDMFTEDNKLKNIIQGITSCGKRISLIRCYSFGSFNFSALTPVVNYKCQFLIEGYLLSDIKANSFNSIKIELPALSKWFYPAAIKRTIQFDDTGKKMQETQISLSKKYGKEETVHLDEGYTISLIGSSGYQEKKEFVTEISITQQTICEISCTNSKIDFYSLLNKAHQFKLFLNLATLSSNTFQSITLVDNDYFQDLGDKDKFIKSIRLFYVDQNENDNTKTHNYLFKYEQIKEVYPQIINSWFNLGKDYAPIRNHLLDSIEKKEVWKSTDFLIIVQALEGYHRRFVNIRANNLKERIENLRDKFSYITKLNITNDDIKHTIKSRNYYSHFYSNKDGVLDGLYLNFLKK